MTMYKKICPYCLIEKEHERERAKYCCYEHLIKAHQLMRVVETARLTDEERTLRTRLLKLRKDAVKI